MAIHIINMVENDLTNQSIRIVQSAEHQILCAVMAQWLAYSFAKSGVKGSMLISARHSEQNDEPQWLSSADKGNDRTGVTRRAQ